MYDIHYYGNMNKSFKPGKYYIGDLCHVISNKNWPIVVDLLENEPDEETVDIAIDYTAHGDGTYTDNKIGTYCVDSGTIGVISIKHQLFDKKIIDKIEEFGKLVDFENDFVFECCDGKFSIGDIKIDTALNF